MKKSELKKYIREIILSEVDIDKTAGSVVMPKTTPPAEIKKITSQNIDVQLKEMVTFSKVKQFEAKYTDDEDVEIEDDWNKPSKDDDGEDEEKIDKKAQATAKKGGSNITKCKTN